MDPRHDHQAQHFSPAPQAPHALHAQSTPHAHDGRVWYFSRIRALACIAVVVLHTFFCAARLLSPDDLNRAVAFIVRNAMSFAVPSFVMVTGALLLNPHKSLSVAHLFKRYLLRVVLVLSVFTFLFVLFDHVVDQRPGGSFVVLTTWLQTLVKGTSWLHMWYLYMLIALYLMLPLYRALASALTQNELRYLLVLLFIFQAALPTLNAITGLQIFFYLFVYTVYPFYLFLGYALHTKQLRISLSVAVCIGFVCTAVLLVLTYLGIMWKNDQLQAITSSYASVLVVGQALGFFRLLQGRMYAGRMGAERAGGEHAHHEHAHHEHVDYKRTNRKPTALIVSLDTCSFGIYILHVLVLYTLYRVLLVRPYELSDGVLIPTLVLLGIAALTLCVSWFLTWLLKHVPLIRRVI